MSLIEKAQKFAFKAHADTNHRYGDNDSLHYSFHLELAATFGKIYLPKDYPSYDSIIAGIYNHDVIEDARVTYNDLYKGINDRLGADIAFALTNEKGKTRSERAPEIYYTGINSQYGARFAKLCDRAANVFYSSITKGKHYEGYKKEHPKFEEYLHLDGRRIIPLYERKLNLFIRFMLEL